MALLRGNAQYFFRRSLRVRDGFHHRRRAAQRVAQHVNALALLAGGGAALCVQFHAVFGKGCRVRLFPHGGDQRIAGQGYRFAGRFGASAAAFVRRAQLHPFAFQRSVFERYGGQQFLKPYALGQRKVQFLFLGGHFPFGAAVDHRYVRNARHTFSGARRVHGGVARACHHDMRADLQRGRVTLRLLQKGDGVGFARNAQPAARLRAAAERHVGKSVFQQGLRGFRAGVAHNVYAQLGQHLRVALNCVAGDAELRDHVAHHAAQRVFFLKDRHFRARAGQKKRQRHTRRAAANDRYALRAVADGRERVQIGAKAPFGRQQLHLPDA